MRKQDASPVPGSGRVSRVKGYLCVAAAIVVVWSMVWGAERGTDAPWWTNPSLLTFVVLVLGYRGARYLKHASTVRFTLADLDHDARPPILLLRPFSEDNAVLGSGPRVLSPYRPSTWKKILDPHAVWLGYRALFSMHVTLEQVLAFSTRQLGPLVAIGQPGAPPVLGAYNVFVGDDWKAVVADLSARAQLVVLIAGSTPGLLWEVKFMLAELAPEKCLIFVPRGTHRRWWPFVLKGDRGRVWDGFRRSAASLFPVALPGLMENAACLAFAADWTPRVLAPRSLSKAIDARDLVAYMLTAIT